MVGLDTNVLVRVLVGDDAGKADLADYLILGKTRSRAARLLTFDRKLANERGVSRL